MRRATAAVVGLVLLAGCAEEPAPPHGDPPSEWMMFFNFDSSVLSTHALATLDKFARVAKTLDVSNRVLACGHADAAGTPEAKLTISRERLEAVRQALIERGIGADRILAEAFGATRPLGSTKAGVREPQNRRVEFTFERWAGLGTANCRIS